MTDEEAVGILKCMALDITGALADGKGLGAMHDVLSQRLAAIDLAFAALQERVERGETDINVGSKWISVEDRLPEREEQVLAYYVGVAYPIGFVQVLTYYAYDDVPHFQHMLGEKRLRVTHWRPLPLPPAKG